MRRFYKMAEAGTAPGGFVVRLDGKPIKTPMHHSLIFPSRDFAEAVAAEWQAQAQDILPATMPLTQLASTMLDKVSHPADRQAMNVEVLKYGASDLVCYFATHPADLVERQETHWGGLLKWLAETHGIRLEPVSGIQYHNQPSAALAALNGLVTGLDAAAFTIVQAATAIAGSLVLALALEAGYLEGAAATEAACVDEIYQLEKWGEDKLARDRINLIRAEFEALVRFRDFIRASA